MNEGSTHNWIKLKLMGQKSNRSAIGTRVVLNTGGMIQSRQLKEGGGEVLYSQGLAPVHFGLDLSDIIDSISIYWPRGGCRYWKMLPPTSLLL